MAYQANFFQNQTLNNNFAQTSIHQYNPFNNQPVTPVINTDYNVEKKLPAIRHRIKENSRLLPQEAIDLMTEWYDQHYTNPYPYFKDCEDLASAGKVSINQVKQWFVNVRRRTQNKYRKRRTNTTNKKIRTDDSNQEVLKSLSSVSSDDSGISNSKEIIDQSILNKSTSPYTVSNQKCYAMPNYSNHNYNNQNYTPNNSQFYNQSYDSPKLQYSNYNYTSTPVVNSYNTNQQQMYANYENERNYNYYYQQPTNIIANTTSSYNNSYSYDC